MTILEEIKALKEKLNDIEMRVSKGVKINDIEVGEQFIYQGHTYTKLNKENFCIIDDYDSNFMRCQFDPISNNYDESLIRYYINSNRFIERLGVNKNDLEPYYKNDLNSVCVVYSIGNTTSNSILYINGVRLGLRLKPNTLVDRNGNYEEEFEDEGDKKK